MSVLVYAVRSVGVQIERSTERLVYGIESAVWVSVCDGMVCMCVYVYAGQSSLHLDCHPAYLLKENSLFLICPRFRFGFLVAAFPLNFLSTRFCHFFAQNVHNFINGNNTTDSIETDFCLIFFLFGFFPWPFAIKINLIFEQQMLLH